jgi:hypothetical protein
MISPISRAKEAARQPAPGVTAGGFYFRSSALRRRGAVGRLVKNGTLA